ncbi:MAG TPA: cation diffusion facilitator family transporter [Actinomycetota bacterium]|nr:cation diffusion facilitator family transporter [Actinomycetota bacterium]
MTISTRFEMPPEKERLYAKATRLEWITLIYLSSAVFFIYLTMGSSQAMKAAWLEDLLSLTPSAAFLVAARFRNRPPNEKFPYGFHRSISIAFLCASVALTLMGIFILFDSVMKLISFEHPSIGTVQPFGQPIWLGWFMLPALLWSAIPAAILGRVKLPLAAQLHDKVLHADAKMNKADWLTASAAMVGVIGIGLGLWWLDPIAAIVISVDILHDGWENLRAVISDLMDSRPQSVDHSSVDPLMARVENELLAMPWVREARVRLREEGHVYFGEAVVVPSRQDGLVENIKRAQEHLRSLDWKLHEIVIMPVTDLQHDELVRDEANSLRAPSS